MATFAENRERLQRLNEEAERARRALFEAQERVTALEAQRRASARGGRPEDPQSEERRRQLEAAIAKATATAEQGARRLAEARAAADQAWRIFVPGTDPRTQVRMLDPRVPALLLPVRLEVRFMTAPIVPRPQLWVRIFPDECAVDAFEPTLSEQELASARRFWVDYWAAGRVQADERGAWRALVASHGAGRAQHIVEQIGPADLEVRATKADRTDIVLVSAGEPPLPAAQQGPAATYFTAVWRADGDEAAEQAARATLRAAVGVEAAQTIVDHHRPANFAVRPQAPRTREEVPVTVSFLQLQSAAATPTKGTSWTQAPRTYVLPERFVLIGYAGGRRELEQIGLPVPWPLVVGPDPSAPPAEQLRSENGELQVGEPLRWMVDFDRAVEWGLGFKVDLDPARAASGFDRLLVIGLRLGADADGGRRQFETLIDHHHRSRGGFALVPQGTPTNNTEAGGAGWSRSEDAEDVEDSFDRIFGTIAQPPGDPQVATDGQILAELLGLDPAVFRAVPGASGTDQSEARDMNVALWPATLGYLMQTMMLPAFDVRTVDATRAFFTRHVSGRGPLPAIRMGQQPYGILAATAWSRLRFSRDPDEAFLSRLHQILRVMDNDWAALAAQVAHVGQAGDPHRVLLEVLGLHSGSVEFHQRYAESLQDLYNRLNLGGAGGRFMAALSAAGSTRAGVDLLQRLGYDGQRPDILDRFFLTTQHRLDGPVVDDVPPSERTPIRPYTDDARNYIGWLADAARHHPERLHNLDGFTSGRAPAALLFILQRHALNLAYWDASARKHRALGVLPPERLATLAREPPFVHLAERAESESRLGLLYKTEPAITGSATKQVLAHLAEVLGQDNATAHLEELIRALERLEQVPTARLERAFAEHIDVCSYRMDAWQTGLVHQRLAGLRLARGRDGTPQAVPGLHLGAYGWLEEVRPRRRTLTPVTPPPPGRGAPVMRDSSNGGYILAPSLNHAVTAAILRNGYLSNATPASPQTLAVDLSSERVRRALAVLDGARAGQGLGALLGYQLERGLHDRHTLAEVDQFIFKLRKAFPLRADRLATTRTGAETPIEAIEARNVVDGLALVEHIHRTGEQAYPFGLALPAADTNQRRALDTEVARLIDTHDAVADLALAEGVHQAAQGNHDRAAATLDAFGRGGLPTEPEVIRTPRTGIGITHRVALHLDAGAPPQVSPVPGLAPTPRGQAEPGLNQWLAAVLPAPDQVCCLVSVAPVGGAPVEQVVTQQQLGLQPIDLLYVVDPERDQALAELDDRVLRHVIATRTPRPDAAITIHYTRPVEDRVTFFQLAPALRGLRALLLQSRPLRASDVALANEARPAQDEAVSLERARVDLPRATLVALRGSIEALLVPLRPLLDDVAAHRAQLIAGIDALLDGAIEQLALANRCGIPQTGWGHLYSWRRDRVIGLLGQVRTLLARWTERQSRFQALLVAYDALPETASNQERLALLQEADRMVSASPILPAPAAADYRLALEPRGVAFAAKAAALAALLQTGTTGLPALIAEVAAALPVEAFDPQGFETTTTEDAIVAQAVDLLDTLTRLQGEVDRRLAAAQVSLEAHDTAATPRERVAALEGAARAMLGEDLRLFPRFEVGAAAAEWQNAREASASGSLLRHVQPPDGSGDLAAVETWLHGIARVRPKMADLEATLLWAEAFGRSEPVLLPVQLPHLPGDHWLGLQFPADHVIDGDRLLYTAHYPAGFDPATGVAGLLLDEWTEVIPAAEETAGLAVHYDRPSSEPPQVMLLVTPPTLDDPWQWADVVDAVNETLDLARKRAVEPTALDRTPYARFLPATLMASALYQVSITANLAVNNGVYQAVAEGPDGG